MCPMNPRLLRPIARRQAPAPGPSDPDFASVSLLLHFDGADQSTTFIDSSGTPKTITALGDAKISTAQSKFGGSSLALLNVGDGIQRATDANLAFGTGDFTIEMWVYLLSGQNVALVETEALPGVGTRTISFVWYQDGMGNIGVYGESGAYQISPSQPAPLNAWTHLALVRHSGVTTTYIGGVSAGSTSGTLNDTIGSFTVGVDTVFTPLKLDGYVDELRVTNGVARYTADFTPPTEPFPNQ